ncbi:MAG: protein kinase [Acidobacteriota bacterium]|nr:protein kinase [Blastocatellia bacterium]MDW8412041.1 protein kinase [Acidobacteriota bacterium]
MLLSLEGLAFPHSQAPHKKRTLVPGLPFLPAELGSFEANVKLIRVWSEADRFYCRLKPPHFADFIQHIPYLSPVAYERITSLRPDLEILWIGSFDSSTWMLLEREPNADSEEYLQYLVELRAPAEVHTVRSLRLVDLKQKLDSIATNQISRDDCQRHLGPIHERGSLEYYKDCIKERSITQHLCIKTSIVTQHLQPNTANPQTEVKILRHIRSASDRLDIELQSPSSPDLKEHFRVIQVVEREGLYLLLYPYDRTEQTDITPPNYLVRLKNYTVHTLSDDEFDTVAAALIDLLETITPGRPYHPTDAIEPTLLDIVKDVLEQRTRTGSLLVSPNNLLSCQAPYGLTNSVPVRKNLADDKPGSGLQHLKIISQPGQQLIVHTADTSPEGPFLSLTEPNQTIVASKNESSSVLFVELIFEHAGVKYIVLKPPSSLSEPSASPRFLLKLHPDGMLETITNSELAAIRPLYAAKKNSYPPAKLLAQLKKLYPKYFAKEQDTQEIDKSTPPIRKYHLKRLLIKGISSSIYEAEQKGLVERSVAIKLLDKDKDSAIFQLEVALTATLSHPHIVSIYDFGELDGQQFCAMPLLEGQTLAELQEIPLRALIKIIDQLASALDYIHERGVTHRQVNLHKIIVDEEYNATLLGVKLTPPEQILKDSLRPVERHRLLVLSDIFNLGFTAWIAVLKHIKRQGKYSCISELPLPSKICALPVKLDEVLTKATAPVPTERYQTAGEFATDFKDALI